MPAVFQAPIRPDIVGSVHMDMMKNGRQPYAVSTKAGKDFGTQDQVLDPFHHKADISDTIESHKKLSFKKNSMVESEQLEVDAFAKFCERDTSLQIFSCCLVFY